MMNNMYAFSRQVRLINHRRLIGSTSRSMGAVKFEPYEPSYFQRFKELFSLSFQKRKEDLDKKAHQLYASVIDSLDFPGFFKACHLEDTFFSWFVVSELHAWMLMVKAMQFSREGRMVRNGIAHALWLDTEAKMRKLGDIAANVRSQELKSLADQFRAAIIGYDEGLLSSDATLAGATWRRFYQAKDDVEPEQIELIVKFIRQNLKHLDDTDWEKLLEKPEDFRMLPLQSAQ